MNADKRPISISVVFLNTVHFHIGVDNFAALGVMIEQPFWVEICILWVYIFFGIQGSDDDA